MSVSLLASAMFIPFSIAISVGFNPIFPDTATRIISFVLSEHISVRPSSPKTKSMSTNSLFKNSASLSSLTQTF